MTALQRRDHARSKKSEMLQMLEHIGGGSGLNTAKSASDKNVIGYFVGKCQ